MADYGFDIEEDERCWAKYSTISTNMKSLLEELLHWMYTLKGQWKEYNIVTYLIEYYHC